MLKEEQRKIKRQVSHSFCFVHRVHFLKEKFYSQETGGSQEEVSTDSGLTSKTDNPKASPGFINLMANKFLGTGSIASEHC